MNTSHIVIDEKHNYTEGINPFAEEYLLRRDKEIITNFKDENFIADYFEYDIREVVIDGKTLEVADKGLYLIYEPRSSINDPLLRLVGFEGISKFYHESNPWTYYTEYGHWFTKKQNTNGGVISCDDASKMFSAIKDALRLHTPLVSKHFPVYEHLVSKK